MKSVLWAAGFCAGLVVAGAAGGESAYPDHPVRSVAPFGICGPGHAVHAGCMDATDLAKRI
jgi:hypothetical protein